MLALVKVFEADNRSTIISWDKPRATLIRSNFSPR